MAVVWLSYFDKKGLNSTVRIQGEAKQKPQRVNTLEKNLGFNEP
jgi:hypothetical protein